MNILAFDTCFAACSVAVSLGPRAGAPRLIDRFDLRIAGHAEALMPMIRDAMAKAGIGFAELDRIAVTAGPGTFTGTRTGIAAARGLALATGLPLIGASSLAVMAEGAVRLLAGQQHGNPFAVIVDARRGQVYAQLFGEDGLDPRSAPLLLSLTDAAVLGDRTPILLAGSGAETVAREAQRLGRTATATLPDLQPCAADLAVMAARLEPVTGPLRPIYLRQPDAKLPPAEGLPKAR